MSDTKRWGSEGMGLRFVTGVVLLLVGAVVLLRFGDRYLSGTNPLSPLTVIGILMAVYLAILLTRLPFFFGSANGRIPLKPIPTLEAEIRDLLVDLGTTIRSYQEQLAGLEVNGVEQARSRLERLDKNVEKTTEELSERRYVSTYRRYYQAQRELIDVIPFLIVADRVNGRSTGRLRELADTLRSQASGISDSATVGEVDELLDSVKPESLGDNPLAFDTSPLKMAARRIDAYRLARLKYTLQLRRALTTLNALLAVIVVCLALLPLLLAGLIPVLTETLPLVAENAPDEISLIFWQFALVLFFGFLGAGVNIVRRLGGGFGFFETGEALELPNDVILKQLLWARLLFGSLAGLVVYVFATSSTGGGASTFSVQFVVITAFFAGFSEQLFDRAVTKAQEKKDGSQKRPGTLKKGFDDGKNDADGDDDRENVGEEMLPLTDESDAPGPTLPSDGRGGTGRPS